MARDIIRSRPSLRRESNSNFLQEFVGNCTLLHVKSKNYHWNVTGPEFPGLHEMFDDLQKQAIRCSDEIAERMRSLQMCVDGRASKYIEDSWFAEGKHDSSAGEMKQDLLNSLEAICERTIAYLNSDETDPITKSLLENCCAELSKYAYFVRSSI